MTTLGNTFLDLSFRTAWPEIAGGCNRVQPCGGGLSGAQVLRITTPGGCYRLDLLPSDWPGDRLAAAAALSTAAEQAELPFMASRIACLAGRVSHGRLQSDAGWLELRPWLAGDVVGATAWSANHSRQSAEALARLHNCTPVAGHGPSAAMLRRRSLLGAGDAALACQLPGAQVVTVAGKTIRLPSRREWDRCWQQAQHLVDQASGHTFDLQPCWGDAWRGNVLFDGAQLTGIIDFAAAVVDTPALDVARLAGSADGDNCQVVLASYSVLRPLSAVDHLAVAAFDASGIVLSLKN
jgi:hypothetical protein